MLPRESSSTACDACAFEGQKAFASSPFVGRTRDDLLGLFGERCMRTRGFRPKPGETTTCNLVTNPDTTNLSFGYVPLWSGCWERS
jgi:hypothetical protein